MSRTTTALKRLGVAGLVAATIGAGIPAFFAAPALANHVTSVNLVPDADTAATGDCNPFTVTVAPPVNGQVVDVILSQQSATGSSVLVNDETATIGFCAVPDPNNNLNEQVPAGNVTAGGTTVTGSTPSAPAADQGADSCESAAPASGSTATVTCHAEFTTDANGQVTFGVTSDTVGQMSVTAFVEEPGTADNAVTPGERNDTSTKTWVQGGTAGATVVDCDPEGATNPDGTIHEFTCKATGAQGVNLQGADVRYVVQTGPNAGLEGDCGEFAAGNATVTPTTPGTASTGVATCRYQDAVGTLGTDSIVGYADQNGNDDFNAGEPNDVISKTWVAAAPAGATVNVTCADNVTTSANRPVQNCQNPTSDTTEVFTATVLNGTTPVVGAVVRWSDNDGAAFDANDTESLSPTECTTNASGQCSTTLTDTRPTAGEVITVTASVPLTGGGAATDTATKTYQNPGANEARNIDLTPNTATNTAGRDAHQVTATVVDRFGSPVAGVQVTFTETGPGRFTNGGSTFTAFTDGNGRAIAETTTLASETGTQTITATLFTGGGTDECEEAAGTSSQFGDGANTPANSVPGAPAGNCADTVTKNWVAAGQSPTPTPTATQTQAPGCDVARSNLPFTINDSDRTVRATAPVTVTVTGARPGEVVELQAYQQNHYGTANFANAGNTRTAIADGNGAATFTLRFSSNARMRAKAQGCAFGANAGFDRPGQGNVLYVSVALFMNVQRVGVRTYVISGDSIPARPGGLIVNIYCTDPRCKNPQNPSGIIAQPRARADNGEYRSSLVRFSAAFQGTRVNILALLRGDAQNVAGQSNVRSLLIG